MSNIDFNDILKYKSIIIKDSSQGIPPEDFVNDKHPIIVRRTSGEWSKGRAIDVNHLTGNEFSYSFTLLIDAKKIKYKQFCQNSNYIGITIDDKLFDYVYNKIEGSVSFDTLISIINEYLNP